MDDRKPLKVKDLKVIDYINTLYATVDGTSMWEIDKSSFAVLKMCDGTKTVDEIAKQIAHKIKMDEENVRMTLKEILDELEKNKFIKYV